MGAQLGNPDWQRRYTTSMAPIATVTYNDNINSVSGLIDSNGFQYLLITTNAPNSLVFAHVKIDWFQDANATLQMGFTDYTLAPQAFIVQKIPVATRYFKIEIGPVGGTTGNTIQMVCYGTNADQENLLTQNTAIPIIGFSNSVASGATQTINTTGIFGGMASCHFSDDTNNLFNVSIDYYDWTTQLWRHFYLGFGASKGQAWTDNIVLPYAPIRANLTNTDTVARNLRCIVMAP